MNKVICMGESLIDFMPSGGDLTFTAKAGGAPSNVCACVAKLGGRGYYLGKMSCDRFSTFLNANMHKYGVNTEYVDYDAAYPTALAFVTLDERGDREFSFYRHNTCDVMFKRANIRPDMFEHGDILHFCSLGLIPAPTKDAHRYAIDCARRNGAMISFDVNIRLGLWDSADKCINAIVEFLPYADIVKVTDEELQLITNAADERTAAAKIFNIAPNCKILIITKGAKGAAVYDRQLQSINRAAVSVSVVDTTGAGDCFIGCVLYMLSGHIIDLDIESMARAIDFASYGCAVVIGKYGAMDAMPTHADIETLRANMTKTKTREQ